MIATQIRAREIRFTEISLAKLGPAKIRAVEPCAPKVGARQVGLDERCARQNRLLKLGVLQVCRAQIGLRKIEPNSLPARKLTSLKGGSAQIHAHRGVLRSPEIPIRHPALKTVEMLKISLGGLRGNCPYGSFYPTVSRAKGPPAIVQGILPPEDRKTRNERTCYHF